MARHGFISNRVFDVIAAGGVVFTDPVAGIDEVFAGLVPTFASASDLRRLLDQLDSHPESFAADMAEARRVVLAEHTFAARARRILEIIRSIEPRR
jgi:spore maturation protein CgeB